MPASERRGDGAAERAGLENRSPRKGTASSNLAPSAIIPPLTSSPAHMQSRVTVSCETNNETESLGTCFTGNTRVFVPPKTVDLLDAFALISGMLPEYPES